MKTRQRPMIGPFLTAAAGFLAAAVGISLLVWHLGNIIGSGAVSLEDSVESVEHVEPLDEHHEPLQDGNVAMLRDAPAARNSATVPAAPTATISAEPVNALRDKALRLPLPGITRRDLQGSFSDARGSSRRHEAIDIQAPRNTPVVAVEDGTIARLFMSRAGGITIYQFDPTERYVYYYAHLERYADGLREKDPIKRGQTIGYVGTSGNAPPDTPHLHFAIFRLTDAKQWWQGSPIDPYEVLRE